MNGIELTTTRANPTVDPSMTIWHWEIPVYLFLGGLVAGIMVIGAIQELRQGDRGDRRLSLWGSIAAISLLSLGMLALFLDLSHKLYVFRFYLAFKPESPMSWGAWILVLAYPALGLWFLTALTKDQWAQVSKRVPLLGLFAGLRSWALAHRRGLLIATAIIGASVGTYTGILLQALAARPLWSSGLLGPLFLASGVSGAAALMMLMKPTRETLHSLVRWDVAALVIEAALLLLFILDKSGGTAVDAAAMDLLVSGPYAGVFFGLVLLGGIITPLFMEIWELRTGARLGWIAPILVLVGGLSLRAVLVAAGQMSNVTLL